MLEAIFVELRACNPERNCSRAWRIAIDRDLFGALVADVTFGRIGKAGRTRRRHYPNENEATALLKTGAYAALHRQTTHRRGLCRHRAFGIGNRVYQGLRSSHPMKIVGRSSPAARGSLPKKRWSSTLLLSFLLTRFLGTYGFPAFQPGGKPECRERELSNFLLR